jgi:peptidoglycan/LPS O-acetylase OafA/YrhL
MIEKNSGHIPVLDGIRAYAVLLVCLLHFFQLNEAGLYQSKWIGIFLFKISALGAKGVELFYILSGFLITGILLDSKKSSKYFTTFYARRFLRIFPLYYFVLFISFLVIPNLYNVDFSGKQVIARQEWLWTYSQNIAFLWGFGTPDSFDIAQNFPWFGHFWSLCVEEHFYLLWPFIIYFSTEKWLPKMMWIIIVISVLSLIVSHFFGNKVPFVKWTTLQGAGILSTGGLVAWYFRKPEKFDRLSKYAERFVWPLGFLLVLIVFIPRKFGINALSIFSSTVFFAALLIVSLKRNNITEKIFNHKSLFFIGKISYGIYVYHGLLRPYFIQFFYKDLTFYVSNTIISNCIYTILCTSISIIIAWLSWNFLEKPILKFKSKFNY